MHCNCQLANIHCMHLNRRKILPRIWSARGPWSSPPMDFWLPKLNLWCCFYFLYQSQKSLMISPFIYPCLCKWCVVSPLLHHLLSTWTAFEISLKVYQHIILIWTPPIYFSNWQQLSFVVIAGITYLKNRFLYTSVFIDRVSYFHSC